MSSVDFPKNLQQNQSLDLKKTNKKQKQKNNNKRKNLY